MSATLTPLEIASGNLYGLQADVGPLPAPLPGATPRAVIESIVLGALQRPPCVVSFSGGRDSSSLLALAADVARRHGLPLPVPITLRFRDAPEAEEDEWQELVVRHVGLTDWERLTFDDEVDVVGPLAQQLLVRHGPVWPQNTHFHLPVFERARGGSLLTGGGGDELFTPLPWRRVALVRLRQRRPTARDVPKVLLSAAPLTLRYPAFRWRHRDPYPLPWLRPRARRAIVAAEARDRARVPVFYDEMLHVAWWPTRYRWMFVHTFQRVGAEHDVQVVHPLAEPAFIAQVGADAGPAGYATRAEAMGRVFDDVVPRAVLERTSKAGFNRPFFNRYSREFVEQWDGSGVDRRLVDAEVLWQVWNREGASHPLTDSLLQTAWLASPAGRSARQAAKQEVDAGRQ